MSWLRSFSRTDTDEPASRQEFGLSKTPPPKVKLSSASSKSGREGPRTKQLAVQQAGRPVTTSPYSGGSSSGYGRPPKQLQQNEDPPSDRRSVTKRLNNRLQQETKKNRFQAPPPPPPLNTGFVHSRDSRHAYALQLSFRDGGSQQPTARSGSSDQLERPLSSPELYAKERRYMERLEHAMRMDRGLDSTPQASALFGPAASHRGSETGGAGGAPHGQQQQPAPNGASRGASQNPATRGAQGGRGSAQNPSSRSTPNRPLPQSQPSLEAQLTPSMSTGFTTPQPEAPAYDAVYSGNYTNDPGVGYPERPWSPGEDSYGIPRRGSPVPQKPRKMTHAEEAQLLEIRELASKEEELLDKLESFAARVQDEKAALLLQFEADKAEERGGLMEELERIRAQIGVASSRVTVLGAAEVDEDLAANTSFLKASIRARLDERNPLDAEVSGNLMGSPITKAFADSWLRA